jgi:plasmid stabilization system protein ParE
MFEVIYHPETEPELVRAMAYYDEQREGLGERFLNDFEQAVADIREYPDAWPTLDVEFRRHQFRHFPFAIIYRILHDRIRVLAIMHLHQHPNYWKCRQ